MSEEKSIMYRGISMIESWPQKIKEAQAIVTYKLGGKDLPRVRYGDEQDNWASAEKQPCGDCGVIKGEFHVQECCDIEECPACGTQLLTCECPFDYRMEDDGE